MRYERKCRWNDLYLMTPGVFGGLQTNVHFSILLLGFD